LSTASLSYTVIRHINVKAAEIYSDRLVLYCCDDFLNDYEGISRYQLFRSDLTMDVSGRDRPRSAAMPAPTGAARVDA
jgi:hypothetical protein